MHFRRRIVSGARSKAAAEAAQQAQDEEEGEEVTRQVKPAAIARRVKGRGKALAGGGKHSHTHNGRRSVGGRSAD